MSTQILVAENMDENAQNADQKVVQRKPKLLVGENNCDDSPNVQNALKPDRSGIPATAKFLHSSISFKEALSDDEDHAPVNRDVHIEIERRPPSVSAEKHEQRELLKSQLSSRKKEIMGDHGGQRKGEQKEQPPVTSRMKINKQGSSLISRIAKGGTLGTSYKDLLK